ncbi:MAG: hypothetical protein GC159_05985 [Phycisphaera sp.]|nr:hypothetical protein [Phycisphaera sp.]
MHSQEQVEAELADEIERFYREGDPWWPSEEVARIAYRRGSSFSRRTKAKHASRAQRTNDLMKGMQTHFEPECPGIAPSEWRELADRLVGVLERNGL